jgi:hypothetical protein
MKKTKETVFPIYIEDAMGRVKELNAKIHDVTEDALITVLADVIMNALSYPFIVQKTVKDNDVFIFDSPISINENLLLKSIITDWAHLQVNVITINEWEENSETDPHTYAECTPSEMIGMAKMILSKKGTK